MTTNLNEIRPEGGYGAAEELYENDREFWGLHNMRGILSCRANILQKKCVPWG